MLSSLTLSECHHKKASYKKGIIKVKVGSFVSLSEERFLISSDSRESRRRRQYVADISMIPELSDTPMETVVSLGRSSQV